MSVRINTLSDDEIRAIGDAFGNYKYEEGEAGLLSLGKSRQAVSDYICGYARMAIKERTLYSTSENHEAFISFKSTDTKDDFGAAMEVLKTIPGNVDIKNSMALLKGYKKSGKAYTTILKKLKIPYIYVGMVAIPEKYQGQGYMRQLLEIVFEEGRKQGLPVVLDTDGMLKRDKYEHLGMKCVVAQKLTDETTVYGLVYEPETIPDIWKSEMVMEDYKILSGENKNVWDKFAPIYDLMVTGTPKNKQAYNAMYKRIKKVVKGRTVLELATGPGIIAKKVADETESIIATDFSAKMVAEARRGVVSSKLRFEQADATELRYEDDSFDVVIIANALHVIPDREKVLDEIKRVLRPGGILIAPNFIHESDSTESKLSVMALKMAGVDFSESWNEDGYRTFLEVNGFSVKNSKVLKALIPMMYTECICK